MPKNAWRPGVNMANTQVFYRTHLFSGKTTGMIRVLGEFSNFRSIDPKLQNGSKKTAPTNWEMTNTKIEKGVGYLLVTSPDIRFIHTGFKVFMPETMIWQGAFIKNRHVDIDVETNTSSNSQLYILTWLATEFILASASRVDNFYETLRSQSKTKFKLNWGSVQSVLQSDADEEDDEGSDDNDC